MNTRRKPDWLKIKLPSVKDYGFMKRHLSEGNLHTICESGKCPNQSECWEQKTATFMIMGDICTRNCHFCSVTTGMPNDIDTKEPKNIANTIRKLNLNHCVLTSVTRDDLPDGGAAIWVNTLNEIRKESPETTIETLIPDFSGNFIALQKVIDTKPEIISHNLETTRPLSTFIRHKAKYDLSLEILSFIKSNDIITKSGIMLGLGEEDEDVFQTIRDLISVQCDILTIGQYLQPEKKNIPVKEYVSPEKFLFFKNFAEKSGIPVVESAPLVRSSYNSKKHYYLLSD